jgi:hypothetical protein
MAELHGPLAEWLADRIPKAAQGGHRRFPRVPAEDFEQVMWEWVLASPLKFRQLFEVGSYGAIWKELSRAATQLGSEDDRYRRACKAAAAGYNVDDEHFYSTGELALLVEVLVQAEWDIGAALEMAIRDTDAAGVHVNVQDPFNGVENYISTLIDISEAYWRLGKEARNLLNTYYGVTQDITPGGTHARQKLAESMGLTYDALTQKVYRARKRLQRELGGQNPWT